MKKFTIKFFQNLIFLTLISNAAYSEESKVLTLSNPIEKLREDFNVLFQAGKYEEAERLLKWRGSWSSDPAQAERILKSLKEFRYSDTSREIAFILYNPLKVTLNYQVRWGEGEWKTMKVKPFKSWRHTSPVNKDNTYGIGKPQVRLRKTNAPEAITFDVTSTIVAKGSSVGGAFNYIAKDDDSEDFSVFNKKRESDNAAVLSVTNSTKIIINFTWKWDVEGNEWSAKALAPGERLTWTWGYLTSKVNTSPDFLIRFDSDLTKDNTMKEYKLDRNMVLKSDVSPVVKNLGHQYLFQVHGYSVLDLHSRN